MQRQIAVVNSSKERIFCPQHRQTVSATSEMKSKKFPSVRSEQSSQLMSHALSNITLRKVVLLTYSYDWPFKEKVDNIWLLLLRKNLYGSLCLQS